MESVPSFLVDSFVAPWHDSLADPERSQQETLLGLLKGYSGTDYGKGHGAEGIEDVWQFRERFPVVRYADLGPLLAQVRAGQESVLLSEPIVRWVMTRGTTGQPKVIPATQTHLSLILSAGARAVVNFAMKRPQILGRKVLNLNFPSEVWDVETGSGKGPVGYSSGTYAKIFPSLGEAVLIPSQEEVDAFGSGISNQDWDGRFELAYRTAKDSDIGSTMGVTPVILAFARYVKRKHGVYPKDVWRPDALFCTSVAKIQSKYAPELRHYFGHVPVVEMYTATEGVFAQQLDALPYVSFNYDSYLFEVQTGRGCKMVHEMARGEWGRLVVSTPIFPRYDIGDLVEAQGKGYFRVLGRAKLSVSAEHVLFNVLTGRAF